MRHAGLGRCRSLLNYDTFEAHVTESVKAVCAKENTNLALIPCRLTSVLKTLVFPEYRKSWMEWMADNIHDLTTSSMFCFYYYSFFQSAAQERCAYYSQVGITHG